MTLISHHNLRPIVTPPIEPAGNLVAVVGSESGGGDPVFYFYDAETGGLISSEVISSANVAGDFSPTGEHYARYILDTIEIFRTDTFAVVGTITTPSTSYWAEEGIRFSPDGTKLAYVHNTSDAGVPIIRVFNFPELTEIALTSVNFEHIGGSLGIDWLDNDRICFAGSTPDFSHNAGKVLTVSTSSTTISPADTGLTLRLASAGEGSEFFATSLFTPEFVIYNLDLNPNSASIINHGVGNRTWIMKALENANGEVIEMLVGADNAPHMIGWDTIFNGTFTIDGTTDSEVRRASIRQATPSKLAIGRHNAFDNVKIWNINGSLRDLTLARNLDVPKPFIHLVNIIPVTVAA